MWNRRTSVSAICASACPQTRAICMKAASGRPACSTAATYLSISRSSSEIASTESALRPRATTMRSISSGERPVARAVCRSVLRPSGADRKSSTSPSASRPLSLAARICSTRVAALAQARDDPHLRGRAGVQAAVVLGDQAPLDPAPDGRRETPARAATCASVSSRALGRCHGAQSRVVARWRSTRPAETIHLRPTAELAERVLLPGRSRAGARARPGAAGEAADVQPSPRPLGLHRRGRRRRAADDPEHRHGRPLGGDRAAGADRARRAARDPRRHVRRPGRRASSSATCWSRARRSRPTARAGRWARASASPPTAR